MRQTLLISIFVNLSVSFQPSDNLYTMLSRVCLLQIITGAYPSEKVNRGGANAGNSPSCGRCGVKEVKGKGEERESCRKRGKKEGERGEREKREGTKKQRSRKKNYINESLGKKRQPEA
ncbi:hypothetical protein C7B69_24710, partial [filamentous cyanobacterium Phorm 46]